MYPAPRSVRIAIPFLLASALLSLTGKAETRPSRAPADGPEPSGLVVVLKNEPKQDRLDLRAVNNPYISGVALQIHWGDIEPVEGKPDWSKLDQLFAAA